MIVLTFCVGLPFYPAFAIPRVTLVSSVLKVILQLWNEFLNDQKALLDEIIKHCCDSGLMDSNTVFPKSVFDFIRQNIGYGNKTTLLGKIGIILILGITAYIVFQDGRSDTLDYGSFWLQSFFSILLTFITHFSKKTI